MRLLLVEDDPMIGASVQRGLRQDGHTVDWVRDGAAADLAVAAGVHELILLDLGLPGKSGLEWLAQWRARGVTLPVLILTARDAVADRVRGLDAGADDYLVKPFSLEELAARLRALGRRQGGRAAPRLELGPLSLDPATHEVSKDGQPVELSAREFALLHALMENPGVPLSRTQLEERLYGWDAEVVSNAVEVHVHHLRRKLGSNFIRTVHGIGYTLGEASS